MRTVNSRKTRALFSVCRLWDPWKLRKLYWKLRGLKKLSINTAILLRPLACVGFYVFSVAVHLRGVFQTVKMWNLFSISCFTGKIDFLFHQWPWAWLRKKWGVSKFTYKCNLFFHVRLFYIKSWRDTFAQENSFGAQWRGRTVATVTKRRQYIAENWEKVEEYAVSGRVRHHCQILPKYLGLFRVFILKLRNIFLRHNCACFGGRLNDV